MINGKFEENRYFPRCNKLSSNLILSSGQAGNTQAFPFRGKGGGRGDFFCQSESKTEWPIMFLCHQYQK